MYAVHFTALPFTKTQLTVRSTSTAQLMQMLFYTVYPKDPRIVPYTRASLKCSHALTSWTCADFLKLNNSLGQVVIQSKKSPTRLGVRAFQSCQGVWHYLWVLKVCTLQQYTLVENFNQCVCPMFQFEPAGGLRFRSQDLWPSTNTAPGTHCALAIEQSIVATAVFREPTHVKCPELHSCLESVLKTWLSDS